MAPGGLFSYETLVHAVAGATGSVAGMAAFFPLEILRSRIQVEESQKLNGSALEVLLRLANDEGIDKLYKGIVPVLQSLCASNFVYFYTFHGLRTLNTIKPTVIQDLWFGTLAGFVNVLATTPLWVVNTRMKLDNTPYKSLCGGLADIAEKEGVGKLWSGCLPSLILVSNPAIQFMCYEAIKRAFTQRKMFNTYTAFLTGALAKSFATILTYPLQLIQVRLRAGTSLKPLFLQARKNPWILFRGLEAKLLQTVLTAALMFTIYEKIVKFVLLIMRTKHRRSI